MHRELNSQVHRLGARTLLLARLMALALPVGMIASCGGGGAGSPASPTTPVATVPGAPALSSTVAADGSAQVIFAAPLSNGGSAVTSYTATCVSAGASRSASGTSSPLSVAGLQNNIEYSCSVVALNSVGAGPASAALTVTPAVARTASITPVLGGFTGGVTVEIFRADSGVRIASGTTADDGKATLTYFSSYQGIQVIKLTGSVSAKYYDERTDTLQPFGPDKFLLAVVPAAIATQPSISLPATVLTHSIAVAAGIDSSSASTVTAPAGLSTTTIKASTDRVLSSFGLDPTKVDPLTVPAYLAAKDQGTGAKLQGSEAALTYGAAVIAITKLTPAGTDVASYTQTIAVAIKTDTVQQAVPQIATLPTVFQEVVRTTVAPSSQQVVTTTPAPGSSPWDSGLWDAANWF